jgi:stage III sporulation protein AE
MRICIWIVVLLLVNVSVVMATPSSSLEIEQQLLETVSPDHVNQFINKMNQEMNGDIPLLTSDAVRGIATKGLHVSWENMWQSVMSNFFHEIKVNTYLMGKLLFLAVLCAVLKNLQNSFEQSSISLLSYSVCFVFMSSIALTAFYNALKLASQTVEYMVGFMESLLPLLLSLLAGVGALTSASLLTPLMLFAISSMSVIVKDVVLPLLFLTAALECLNYLSETYRLSNLAGVLKQISMIVLGFSMVIFIGFITIQGAAGSVADGLALRTAKFATATFVPVVGKMFADTVELVMGASLLLKNAVGIFGVLIVFMICVFPLIKLLSLILVIKISGALVQPLGDEKMAKCLDSMGNNLLLVFGAILTVALMFFLAITMIIATGSAAMMLR